MLVHHYDDWSSHVIPMMIMNTRATYSQCKGFHVKMWQETHGGKGHDTWKFDVNIVLKFSDGSELNAYRGGQVLVSNSTADCPTIEYNQQLTRLHLGLFPIRFGRFAAGAGTGVFQVIAASGGFGKLRVPGSDLWSNP